MEKVKAPKSGIFLSEEIIDDHEFISELELITDCYYNYLSNGFNILEGIFFSIGNDGAADTLKKEISVIRSYLEGKPSTEELFIESMDDNHPKYGKRRLPEIKNNIQVSQVYKHIVSNSEVEIWRHNEFDLLQELAIAKCKALVRYESFINAQLKRLRVKDDEAQMVKSFHWIGDAVKLEKLFKLLMDNQIIECEEKDFKIAFSGKSEKHSKIKWLLIGRKNKLISKKSIFNFIEKLMNKAYINKINEGILNKVIESVFVDNKGKPLANLRQSNSTVIDKPHDDLITGVINELRNS
jgi:hypothetical protein